MPWSVLQSWSNTNTSGNVAVTFVTANLSAGTKILAWVSVSASASPQTTVSAVKDGALNAWTQLAVASDNAADALYLFALDTPAGDAGTKPTITATIGTNFGSTILVQEVSGLLAGNTSAMLDGAAGLNHGTSAGPATSGAYSSSAAGEFLVFAAGEDGNAVTFGGPTSGYTADPKSVNGSSAADLEAGYKNSAGAAESGSSTITGSTGWATILAAFKLASVAAPAGPAYTASMASM
jgi:hypothetical protein